MVVSYITPFNKDAEEQEKKKKKAEEGTDDEKEEEDDDDDDKAYVNPRTAALEALVSKVAYGNYRALREEVINHMASINQLSHTAACTTRRLSNSS